MSSNNMRRTEVFTKSPDADTILIRYDTTCMKQAPNTF